MTVAVNEKNIKSSMVPYLKFKEGDQVEKGNVIAEWDPYSNPIITEVTGVVKFQDIEEGVTMTEQVDAVTGFSTK